MSRSLLVALLLVTTAACGNAGVRVIPSEELPPEIYDPQAQAQRASVVLYFVEDGLLHPVNRTVLTRLPLEETAMRVLLDGPSEEEEERGLDTGIPLSTELQQVRVEDGVAMVDLTRPFYVAENPLPDSVVLRLAQIVWTLTELPGVNAVQFMEGGRRFDVIDQEQELVVDAPVARGRYSRYQPLPPESNGDPGVGI